jgi:hypothetical protein
MGRARYHSRFAWNQNKGPTLTERDFYQIFAHKKKNYNF